MLWTCKLMLKDYLSILEVEIVSTSSERRHLSLLLMFPSSCPSAVAGHALSPSWQPDRGSSQARGKHWKQCCIWIVTFSVNDWAQYPCDHGCMGAEGLLLMLSPQFSLTSVAHCLLLLCFYWYYLSVCCIIFPLCKSKLSFSNHFVCLRVDFCTVVFHFQEEMQLITCERIMALFCKFTLILPIVSKS